MQAGFPIFWASVLLPIIVGLAAWLTRPRGRAVNAYAYASMLVLILPLIYVIYYAAKGALEQGVLDPLYWNAAYVGAGTLALALDALSAPVVAGVSLVTAIVALYSVEYMGHRIEEMRRHGEEPPGMGAYFMMYNLFAAAMLGLALSTNLILFYIFLELTLIPSFLLIAYYGYGDRRKISLLYFVWTHVGAALLLAGILIYGFRVGTFDYLQVPSLKPVGDVEQVIGGAAKLAAALMMIGLLVKMAVMGVHMWLPYAHAEAPTPISALLSPNLIGLAGYALARFVVPAFPAVMEGWRGYLVTLAIATIIYGGLVALMQKDFKRFLAYSSVSQMGYLLAGIATLTPLGIAGAMLHYLAHAIGKAILFMTAGVFITSLGLRDMTKMGGLARFYPTTAALALFGFMHLVGMPPSFGLWGEVMIIMGLTKVYSGALTDLVLLTIGLIIALAVSAAYSFIAMRRIFYGQPKISVRPWNERNTLVASMLFIAILGFLFFLTANLFIGPLYGSSFLSSLGG